MGREIQVARNLPPDFAQPFFHHFAITPPKKGELRRIMPSKGERPRADTLTPRLAGTGREDRSAPN